MSTIHPGDAVRLTAAFVDAADAPADPTTITLRVRPKGAAETAYVYGVAAGLIRDGVGAYHLDYVVPSGLGATTQVEYRWEAGGSVTAVEEGEFFATTRFYP